MPLPAGTLGFRPPYAWPSICPLPEGPGLHACPRPGQPGIARACTAILIQQTGLPVHSWHAQGLSASGYGHTTGSHCLQVIERSRAISRAVDEGMYVHTRTYSDKWPMQAIPKPAQFLISKQLRPPFLPAAACLMLHDATGAGRRASQSTCNSNHQPAPSYICTYMGDACNQQD